MWLKSSIFGVFGVFSGCFCQETLRSKTSLRFIFNSTRVPPKRKDNSSPVNIMVDSSPKDGHLKRPFSKRLKYSQNPSPSHSSIFMRLRLRLQNTNNAPQKGSSLKLHSTIADNPLMLFLMSVCPQAKYIRLPDRFSVMA